MKSEGNASKGTPVIEPKRCVADGQDKYNMSPPEREGGGRHKHLRYFRIFVA